MITKLEWTESKAQQNIERLQNPHNGSNNQQQMNNNRTIALERTAAKATRGLNAFYLYQIFALNSAVEEAHIMLRLHGGFLSFAMYHHRETVKSQ